MEQTPIIFNLDKEIETWQQQIQSGALTPDDVEELTHHLQDEISELSTNGLSEEEAWFVARHRIGQPITINSEFTKVNPDFAANRNLLMLFWGATFCMFLQTFFFCFNDWLLAIPGMPHKPLFKLLTIDQACIVLYILSTVLVCIVLGVVLKSVKLLLWFNAFASNHSSLLTTLLVTVGVFAAAINYRGIATHITLNYNDLEVRNAASLLGFIFYGSLIFCTAWFTMRYRKKEFRTPHVFFTNINWVNSLCIGIIAESLVCTGNLFRTLVFKYMLIAVLYTIAGYIITKSKKPYCNLFTVQISAFLMCWLLGYLLIHHSFLICATQYSAVLMALFTGFAMNKIKQTRLQLSR